MSRTLKRSHNVHRDFQSERWRTFQGYTTFCFLTVIFSVIAALLGVILNAILRSHVLPPPPLRHPLLLIFNIR